MELFLTNHARRRGFNSCIAECNINYTEYVPNDLFERFTGNNAQYVRGQNDPYKVIEIISRLNHMDNLLLNDNESYYKEPLPLLYKEPNPVTVGEMVDSIIKNMLNSVYYFIRHFGVVKENGTIQKIRYINMVQDTIIKNMESEELTALYSARMTGKTTILSHIRALDILDPSIDSDVPYNALDDYRIVAKNRLDADSIIKSLPLQIVYGLERLKLSGEKISTKRSKNCNIIIDEFEFMDKDALIYFISHIDHLKNYIRDVYKLQPHIMLTSVYNKYLDKEFVYDMYEAFTPSNIAKIATANVMTASTMQKYLQILRDEDYKTEILLKRPWE